MIVGQADEVYSKMASEVIVIRRGFGGSCRRSPTRNLPRRVCPGGLRAGLVPYGVGIDGVAGVGDGVHDRSLPIIWRAPNSATINEMLARGCFSMPMQPGMSSDDNVRVVFLEQPVEKGIRGGGLPEEFNGPNPPRSPRQYSRSTPRCLASSRRAPRAR